MTEPRILVVDDSEIIREMLASFLGTLGYRVDVAPDGQSALDKFLVFRYQLIISDLQMPFVEGLSLLKQVKAIAAQTQVIILTGHATLDSAVEALRLGAYDYQFKPLDNMESFARLLDWALKGLCVVDGRTSVWWRNCGKPVRSWNRKWPSARANCKSPTSRCSVWIA